MSDTTYVDYVAPAVSAEWLNEINNHVWHDTPVFGTTIHEAINIKNTPSGFLLSTEVQGALDELGTKVSQVISVQDAPFNAKGDGVTDDTSAIQAAIDSLVLGNELFFPAGIYKVSNTLTISVSGVKLTGAGVYATNIVQSNTTSDTFVFSSTQWSGISGMKISHSGTPTAGYAVKFQKTAGSGCFFSYAKDLFILNMWNGIDILSSTETQVERVHLRGLKGTRGVLFEGAIGEGSYGARLKDVSGDTAGNGNTSIVWFRQDSYAYTFTLDRCVALNGGFGLQMADTANTGTSYPMWCYVNGFEADHNNNYGIFMASGEGLYCTNSWIGSSLVNSGVLIGATFRGEVDIGGSRIMGCAQHGVWIAAGPADVRIHDNTIGDNSTVGAGTYHGVFTAANASKFSIQDNRIGDLVGTAGNNQGYGVFVDNGTATDFEVTGNTLTGNTTGSLFNGATGASGKVANNIGYNPVGASAVTVTASPMSYQAGFSDETLYIKGGTVSSVVVDGRTLFTATNCTIRLPTRKTAVITYTVAPTIETCID